MAPLASFIRFRNQAIFKVVHTIAKGDATSTRVTAVTRKKSRTRPTRMQFGVKLIF